MYNPHSSVESHNLPGPADYNSAETITIESKTKAVNDKQTTGNFSDGNTDRFGNPVLPLRPDNSPPGPGAYKFSLPSVKSGFPTSKSKRDPMFFTNEPKGSENVGPSHYYPLKEPKKVSFLFNSNDQWVC